MKLIPYAGYDPGEDHHGEQVFRTENFVAQCLAMFDEGMNSAEIARRMVVRECAVATAIRLGREARRGA